MGECHLVWPLSEFIRGKISLGRGLGDKPGAPIPYPEIVELMDLADNTAAVKTSVPVDEPLFQAFPSKLVFTDYEPFGVYTKTLYFRNNDVVPRRIRLEPLDSEHFFIQANPRKADRIASGMEVSWTVTFRPHKRRDYNERLVRNGERKIHRQRVRAGSHDVPRPSRLRQF